jgi:hypothetical protein
MLIKIPVKFLILAQAFLEVHMTQHFGTVFTKSRAIALQILNKYTSKPPGAQLHMLINISVS